MGVSVPELVTLQPVFGISVLPEHALDSSHSIPSLSQKETIKTCLRLRLRPLGPQLQFLEFHDCARQLALHVRNFSVGHPCTQVFVCSSAVLVRPVCAALHT